MSLSVGKEVQIFLKSVSTGVILWAVYDCLRILRIWIPHKKLIVGLEDVIFWIACAIGIFDMLYWENDGFLRGFSIGGIILGMLLYGVSVSPWILKMNVRLLFHVKKLLRKIGKTVRMNKEK